MIRMMNAWGVQDWLTGAVLDDFSGEDWWKSFEGSNPAIWILGHVLGSRRHLAKELGMDVAPGEEDKVFDMGTDPADLPKDLDPAAILEAYHDLNARMMEHLEGIDVATLEEPIDSDYPTMPKTRLGALQFLFLHECYHVGQLSSIRKMLGKPPWMPTE